MALLFVCFLIYLHAGILATDAADAVLLKSNIVTATKLVLELMPHLETVITARIRARQAANQTTNANLSSPSPASNGAVHGNRARANSSIESAVLLLTSRLLGAAEELKQSAVAMRPKPSARMGNNNTSNEDAGASDPLSALLSTISSLNSAPVGIEKLAFPMMKVRLRDEFWMEDLSLLGVDGNFIDAVYVPSRDRKMAAMAAHLSTTAADDKTASSRIEPQIVSGVSSQGTVLYCPPNAGIFECLSQCPAATSWLSFYTQLGFDVVLFNYRGFCRSNGGKETLSCRIVCTALF